MQKIPKATLAAMLAVSIATSILPSLVSTTNAAGDWALVIDGRPTKAYSDLRETVWQKNATLPPNGPYDMIGLHRLVKAGTTPKAVMVICPGTYCNGAEQILSNPSTDNYTLTENYSQPIYWANRGYDVYTVDYRTHFVPLTLRPNQTSFMAEWGYDQWISDVKETVDKAKQVSGASKVFLAGESFGGSVVMFYASKYWQEDLRGLILLDGGSPVKSTRGTNTYNLTGRINQMKISGNISMETPYIGGSTVPPSGTLYVYQYALQNPGAPAQYPPGVPLQPTVNTATNRTWNNITEYVRTLLSPVYITNIAGNNGNLTAYLHWMATMDRYWPMRLGYEAAAITDWTNCPYVAYDYDDHYKEVNVPILSFQSGMFGLAAWGSVVNGMATQDFSSYLLSTYGHTDIYTGINSARDVSQPTVDWMNSQLVGLKATAFCSVRVLPGWTWNFFAHSSGGVGAHTYQWYEGTTPLQGQTNMVLPVSKNVAGAYTFYCKVTDSQGNAAASNTVTLSVIG